MAHRLPEESLRTMLFVAAQKTVSLIRKLLGLSHIQRLNLVLRILAGTQQNDEWTMTQTQNSTLSPNQIKSSEHIWINIHWGLNRCQAPRRGLQSGKTGYKQKGPLSSGAPGPKADFSVPSRGWGFLVLQIHRESLSPKLLRSQIWGGPVGPRYSLQCGPRSESSLLHMQHSTGNTVCVRRKDVKKFSCFVVVFSPPLVRTTTSAGEKSWVGSKY